MASLADFLPIAQAQNEAEAGFKQGVSQQRTGHELVDESNRDAGRGSFYSGNAIMRSDWIRQQGANDISDIQFGLQRQLQQLTLNRLMAATGVSSIA